MVRPVHEVRLPPFKVALFIFVILIFISLSFLAGYKAGLSAGKEEKTHEKKFLPTSWKEVSQLEEESPPASEEKKSVIEEKPKEKKPAEKESKSKLAESKKYAIQVAAFTEKARAEREAQRLREKGYLSFIIMEKTSGKTFYKVLIGPYENLEKASQLKKDLEKKEKRRLLLRRLS